MRVDQSLIFFEISETYDISDDNLQSSILSVDKEEFKISINVFGTKYSTIKRLIELLTHEVKFDRFLLKEAQKPHKGYYFYRTVKNCRRNQLYCCYIRVRNTSARKLYF